MNAFKTLAFAAVLSAAAAASSAQAGGSEGPSFNCARAWTWVEKMICRDPSLADKDRRMAMAYRSLLEQAREGGGPDADLSDFRNEQRAWLRERDRCRSRACLHAAYDKRIGDVTVDY